MIFLVLHLISVQTGKRILHIYATLRHTDKYATQTFNIEGILKLDNKISIAVDQNLGKPEEEGGGMFMDEPIPPPLTICDHPP